VLDEIEAALGGSFVLDDNDELALQFDGEIIDLHTVARDLYYHHDWSQRRIAIALDRSPQTVRRWLSYTINEAEKAKCRDYKSTHRAQVRANDRAYRQRVKIPCPVCHHPMGPDATLCRDCRDAAAEARRTIIAGCYADGWKLTDIADVLETNTNSMNVTLNRLRKDGQIGYRYLVDEHGLRLPGAA
jgi:hypothetical protein